MEAGTYKPQTLERLDLTEGYTIAIDKRYEAIIITSAVDLIIDTVDAYRALAMRLGTYIGVWSDSDYTYIDLVEVRNCTRNEAIRLARAREQLAIWDNANNCEQWATDSFAVTIEGITGYSSLSEQHAREIAQNRLDKQTLNGKV